MSKLDLTEIVSIAAFIRGEGETTFEEIAEHYGVDVNLVIDAVTTMNMTETGANAYFLDVLIDVEDEDDESPEVHYTPRDRISVQARGENPLIYLTAGEAVVAAHLLDRLLALLGPGVTRDDVASLRQLIVNVAADRNVTLPHLSPPEAPADVLAAVWDALRTGRVLEVDYHKVGEFTEQTSRRSIVCCGLYSRDRVYVGALDGKKNLKWYRLDRMSNPALGHPVAEVDLERARRAWNRYDKPGNIAGDQVHLITTRSGRWVAELVESSHVHDNGDTLDISLPAGSLPWLRQVCLLLGEDLLDIRPSDVKERVVASARALLECATSPRDDGL